MPPHPPPTPPIALPRREALRRIGLLVGGGVLVPVGAATLPGCRRGTAEPPYEFRVLSGSPLDVVKAVADAVIPDTDTPGAVAAGVPECIDALLADWYPASDRDQFVAGLEEIRASGPGDGGWAAYVTRLDQAAYGSAPAALSDASTAGRPSVSEPTPFDPAAPGETVAEAYRTLKELVVEGYYTSEVGQTVELHVNPMGGWEGDIAFSDVGKAWAA